MCECVEGKIHRGLNNDIKKQSCLIYSTHAIRYERTRGGEVFHETCTRDQGGGGGMGVSCIKI